MNAPYAAAAILAILGAAIHGTGGELWVLRRLRVDTLAPTPFGGPEITLLFIRASWHLLTAAFLTMGAGLGICAGLEPGGACRGVGLLTSGVFGAFFVGAVAGVVARRRPSMFVRHPGPAVFALVAALSWWGA